METRRLDSGAEMPVLGLGVWQLAQGRETEQAIGWAFDAGDRHIDTATMYRNEESVGAAIRRSGLAREDMFVTTKILPTRRNATKTARAEPAQARARPRRPLSHPLAAASPGTHRCGARSSRCASAASRSTSASATSAHGVSSRHSRERRDGRFEPDRVQPVSLPPRAARLLPRERHRVRGVQPARPRQGARRPRDRRRRRTGRPNARAGRPPLGGPARGGRDPEVRPEGNPIRARTRRRFFDFALSEDDVAALDALDRTGGTREARRASSGSGRSEQPDEPGMARRRSRRGGSSRRCGGSRRRRSAGCPSSGPPAYEQHRREKLAVGDLAEILLDVRVVGQQQRQGLRSRAEDLSPCRGSSWLSAARRRGSRPLPR